MPPTNWSSPCHSERAKRAEESVELRWSALIAISMDPSARTLRVLGRDDNPIGLPGPARHHVI